MTGYKSVFAGILFISVIVITYTAGTGISTDSVHYIKTAESMLHCNRLNYPLVSWNSAKTSTSLTHHAPLLSLLIFIISKIFFIKPLWVVRILHAFCLSGTFLLIISKLRKDVLSIFITLSLLLGDTIFFVNLWAWSEPPFILTTTFFGIFPLFCSS